MKKVIVGTVLATGLFLTGGATGMATGDWFEELIANASSKVGQQSSTISNAKSEFEKRYEVLKQDIIDNVGDTTIQQKNNVSNELESHKNEKLKEMEKEMIGGKLQEARSRINEASVKAYEDGAKAINEEYEAIMNDLK